MKPTIQYPENAVTRATIERELPISRRAPIDYAYQAGSLTSLNDRCFGSRNSSFRMISEDYFKTEAPHIFAGEAGFFAVIVLTAAVPLLNGAQVLLHFVRSLGAF